MARRTVLLINKFYHDVGPAGGVGRYLLQEEEDLAERGWSVVPFAMKDADARPSRWDRFFVRAHDYASVRFDPAGALSLIWNREAARNLDALLREVRPDVVHVHNAYHHLSPSILPVLQRHRLPVVMTLHDLRLLCPAIHMLRDGSPCERCRDGRLWNAVLGACVKGSRPASLLAAAETWNHRVRNLYPTAVHRFLCPSAYYAGKYADWGYPEENLIPLPNFVDTDRFRPDEDHVDDAYLYFGRLSREKGLATLLRAHAAWQDRRRADGAPPPPALRIAGSGPAEAELRALARGLGLDDAVFLGALPPDGLAALLPRMAFSVLPSEWYENGPLSLLESLACGVPVVGADIAGIPECLDDGREGVLFRSGDAADLVQALERAAALGLPARVAARERALARHRRDKHMDSLEAHLVEVAAEYSPFD